MYCFSRSIYRLLAPYIIEDGPGRAGPTNHERVLRACEAAVYRLATDWQYFAKPSKTLFNDIRSYFPIAVQPRVFRIVDHHMTFARAYFASRPLAGYDPAGNPIECRATTRRGTQCRRTPLPHNGYCPSHQHLAEPPEIPLAA
jgi:hypothetical protein